MRKEDESGKSDNARGITRMSDDQRLGLTMIIMPLNTTMKTMETIVSDIFIIPNPSWRYKDSMAQENGIDPSIKKFQRLWNKTTDQEYRMSHDFADEHFVQVWLVTPGESDSNWSCHGIDGYPELKGWRPFGYLPKSIFAGHVEGDCITIDLPIEKWEEKDNDITVYYTTTIKVQLQLSQLKYRYKNHGNFEDVLARV